MRAVIGAGEVISYLDMCQEEGVNLQRGMNFKLRDGVSVVLMSVRKGAPYADRIEEDGRVLIYEGHDVPREAGRPDPKSVDQPLRTGSGGLTQNGLFYEAAKRHSEGGAEPERVRVYESSEPAFGCSLASSACLMPGARQVTDVRSSSSGSSSIKTKHP